MTIMQQFELQLLKGEMAEKRIAHEVKGATLVEEMDDEGKEINSIQQLMDAVEAGERTLREQITEPYEYSKMDEFYDLIATTDAKQKLTVERLIASQSEDPFCRAMTKYLEDGELDMQIEDDSDFEEEEEEDEQDATSGPAEEDRDETEVEVKEHKKQKQAGRQRQKRAAEEIVRSAPYFAISETGTLMQLQQRKVKAKSRQARELEHLQRIYIPHHDEALQRDLIDAVHHEAGHTSPRKTYQLLLQRVYWKGLYTSVHNRLRACAKCQFYSVKAAKAPFLGHTMAVRCGQKLALDVIRLPKAEGSELVLTAIDVFSRYAFLVPVPDLKAATILKAMRENILPHGMGKPEVYLVDGGSEFKKEVGHAIDAWLADKHVHGAHRHEAAGCIESFNKTIEKRIAMFCDEEDLEGWIHVWPEALEAYNATVQEACSGSTYVAFSPAEIFLGRKLRFSVDKLAEEAADELISSTPESYFAQMEKRSAQVVRAVNEARKEYFEKMEQYDPQSKVKVRTFNVGEEVTVYAPTKSKKVNKLSALQEGPYEIVEADGTGTQYRIKRMGAGKSRPRWVHLDQIKKFRRFMVSEEDGEEMIAAKPHSKQYTVFRVVGERGKTRRSKQFRIQWKDYDKTTWEPALNLDHCKQAIRDWTLLNPEEQEKLLASNDQELQDGLLEELAAEVPMAEELVAAHIAEQAPKTSSTHIQMDLTPKVGQYTSLLKRICRIAGVSTDCIRSVMSSPPCETLTLADASNISRDNFYRDHSIPDKPPRSAKSCTTPAAWAKRRKAINHDNLVKQIVRSFIRDRKEGASYDMLMENPLGSLRQRPYMRGEAVEELL